MKTIDQQITMMRLHWPDFVVGGQSAELVRWRGPLAGNEKTYEIEITHGIPLPGLAGGPYDFPIVRVLWPELKPNFDAEEEAPLPHVYFNRSYLPASPLCLFDPDKREWTQKDYLALTTVPWAADWLACYEAWRATGKWFGGGRHGRRPPLSQLRKCA